MAIFVYTLVLLYAARLKSLGPHQLDRGIRGIIKKLYARFPSESKSTSTAIETPAPTVELSKT